MDFIYDLIGRFHPLFVHLPIGFIIIGLMLDFFFRNKKEHLPVLRFVFLWAFITSIFSIITGYLQYDREGYAWNTVQWHLVMGIFTMAFCFLFYLNLKYENIIFTKPNSDSGSDQTFQETHFIRRWRCHHFRRFRRTREVRP